MTVNWDVPTLEGCSCIDGDHLVGTRAGKFFLNGLSRRQISSGEVDKLGYKSQWSGIFWVKRRPRNPRQFGPPSSLGSGRQDWS